MKRLIILILSVSLLCGMLAACGGTDDSAPAAKTAPAQLLRKVIAAADGSRFPVRTTSSR